MNRRKVVKFGLAALSTTAIPSWKSAAQTQYPTRPVKLVVPFAAGGLVDIIGRLWAEKVGRSLGTVFIENQGGGGGLIGATAVARAEPDGYTILLGNSSTQVLLPAVISRPPYDVARDFAAVAILCVSATCIVVGPKLPVKDLKGLIAFAKTNPDKLSYGSAGAGSMTNLAGELFKRLIGVPGIIHIPYRGAGPALTDVISGNTPMITPNITAQLLEYHRAGTLRILSVNAPARLAAAPDIPTSTEAGMPGMVLQVFNGLFVPARTPTAIIAKIADATRQAKQEMSFRKKLEESGFEGVADLDPRASQHYVDQEAARLSPIIKEVGFTMG